MKKLFLFLSAMIMSLGLFATDYDVVIDNYDFILGSNNDIRIEDQLGGVVLQKDDNVWVRIKGYFSANVNNIEIITLVDGSEAAENWLQLNTGWPIIGTVGPATAGVECDYSDLQIPIKVSAVSGEKVMIRIGLATDLSDGTTVKLRPTDQEDPEGTTYTVELGSCSFTKDNDNYKVEIPFETAESLKQYDIIKVVINGVFSQDLGAEVEGHAAGINFMMFSGATTAMDWTNRSVEITKGETVSLSYEFTMSKAWPDGEYKIGIYFGNYDEEKPLTFLKDGDVAHDPVELANKTYTNVSLALNDWGDGSNYKYLEAIVAPADGFLAGDYVTYTIKGVASEAIEGLQVYLENDAYTAVSEYKLVAENVAKDGVVDVTGTIALSSASDVCNFVIVTKDVKKDGVETITIGEGGSQDAVEEVSAVDFENGVVYSAGKIEVYNVAGQIKATASQQFDTKSLNSGVYFITAPEGTIKIQK